ncbi:putative Fe-Mo cluster-binding NifX family protein [Desulfitispora alkaliphila]|uniref:NifB/NifX family molybdenum-iron cluster-binding protein n=1 Tax=Desulfitispora alkaliphila TaxID=622674 RepID=UPI003D1C63D0
MKIVVATENTQITDHFGHCQGFNIFNVQNNEVVDSEFIENPGHRPGFLPKFLSDLGAKIIISGGMGGAAIDIFNKKGIQVIVGVKGEAQDAVESYLKGELVSTGSACHEHTS